MLAHVNGKKIKYTYIESERYSHLIYTFVFAHCYNEWSQDDDIYKQDTWDIYEINQSNTRQIHRIVRTITKILQ